MHIGKVLYVINSLSSGGAERLILDVVPKLLDQDIQCDVLVISEFNNTNGIVKELIDRGVVVSSLKAKNIYSPINILRLRKYLKRYKVIHTHLFPTQYWVAFCKVLFNLNNKLYITTEHNTYNRRRNIFLFKYLDKFVYSNYNNIIAISADTNNSLVGYLPCLESKLLTINNGVDLTRFNKPLTNSNLFGGGDMKGKKILAQVAGFRKQKDQKTLIKALCLLPKEYIVVFAGDGELIDECKNLVAELDLQDRVFFLGTVSDIPELLSQSYLVIVSSHWEGFGLVAVEGMASRKPVIASNVEGLSRVVEGAGCLFDKGNYEQLASIILDFNNSQSLYEQVARRCYERSKEYDINKMVKEIILLYEKNN